MFGGSRNFSCDVEVAFLFAEPAILGGGLEAGCCDPQPESHTLCRIQQPGLQGAADLLQQSLFAYTLQ